MIIFTSICANYLHKARTLAKSVKENVPGATFIVCLLEKDIPDSAPFEYFDEIVLAKDAWEGNFERFIFKHTIVEASTSVKGQFFRYLFKRYEGENQFIYLDPDVYVYSDLIELKEILREKPIVLCPHLLQPGNIDMELSSTAHGVYNLGFLAVNNSQEAKDFINWWADRLFLFCYDDIGKGIFTDQKWIDLAPCFFNVEILKHRGYDFAPWSLLDCGMYKQDDSVYIKGDKLRFIHFSGFGACTEECMRKWLPAGDHIFKELYAGYSRTHQLNDLDNVSKTKWSYSVYSSGEKIKDEVRLKYRANYDIMFLCDNPFEKSNIFYENIIENRFSINYSNIKIYFQKAREVYKREGLEALVEKVKSKIINK